MNREMIRSPIPDESLNTLPDEKQQLKRVLRTAFSCSVLALQKTENVENFTKMHGNNEQNIKAYHSQK